ncbi:MFS domain-containing protein, variant 2 [Balamuthia mandrillaris]
MRRNNSYDSSGWLGLGQEDEFQEAEENVEGVPPASTPSSSSGSSSSSSSSSSVAFKMGSALGKASAALANSTGRGIGKGVAAIRNIRRSSGAVGGGTTKQQQQQRKGQKGHHYRSQSLGKVTMRSVGIGGVNGFDFSIYRNKLHSSSSLLPLFSSPSSPSAPASTASLPSSFSFPTLPTANDLFDASSSPTTPTSSSFTLATNQQPQLPQLQQPNALHSSSTNSTNNGSSSNKQKKKKRSVYRNIADMPQEMKGKLSQLRLFFLCLYWFSRGTFWSAFLILLLPNQVLTMVGEGYKGTTVGIVTLAGALTSIVAFPLIGSFRFFPRSSCFLLFLLCYSSSCASSPSSVLSCISSLSFLVGTYSNKKNVTNINSDRTSIKSHFCFPVGRRLPFLGVGAVLLSAHLLLFPLVGREGVTWVVPYCLSYALVACFDAVASAPYTALVPDIVPDKQLGMCSGWIGLMTMFGNLLGGGVLGFFLDYVTVPGAFFLLAGVQILGMLGTVLMTREQRCFMTVRQDDQRNGDSSEELYLADDENYYRLIDGSSDDFMHISALSLGFLKDMCAPFLDSNFFWVFCTRFLVSSGFQIVIQFLQYFIRDTVERPYRFLGLEVAGPEAAASVFALNVTLGALGSSLIGGIASDKCGRKVVIYVSNALMAFVPIALLVFHPYWLLVVSGLIFGVGYGAYTSVDFALVSDVLPSSKSYAKDMGVWHISWTLPTLVAPALAGLLLDNLQPLSSQAGVDHIGYKAIFLLSGMLFVGASILVQRITLKGERRRIHESNHCTDSDEEEDYCSTESPQHSIELEDLLFVEPCDSDGEAEGGKSRRKCLHVVEVLDDRGVLEHENEGGKRA